MLEYIYSIYFFGRSQGGMHKKLCVLNFFDIICNKIFIFFIITSRKRKIYATKYVYSIIILNILEYMYSLLILDVLENMYSLLILDVLEYIYIYSILILDELEQIYK